MQKHKMKLAIGGGVLAVLVVVALVLPTGTSTLSSASTSTSSTTATTNSSASADSDSDSTEAETVQVTKATKVALSKALSKKSVWFKGTSVRSSSSQLGVAYVFDGKGNATEYYTTGLTAASLKGKSTDEIIKLVKKADKDWFKKEQQEQIDTYTSSIQSTKKKIADIQNGTSSSDYEDNYTKELDKCQEAVRQIKALKYEAPSANPFSLHIITAADGKSTGTETIQYTSFSNRGIRVKGTNASSEAVTVEYVATEGGYQLEFTEDSMDNVSTFSGMSFRKFGNLTKLLDEGTNEQYVLDKPNAKGVTVDI